MKQPFIGHNLKFGHKLSFRKTNTALSPSLIHQLDTEHKLTCLNSLLID